MNPALLRVEAALHWSVLLQTLGNLELHGASCSRPKSLLLLSYLAMEGPQERAHLGDLFFRRAVNRLGSLRTTLQRLRREVPGAVGEQGSRLFTHLPCDARQMLDLLDAENLDGGTALYSGAFLSGVYRLDWSVQLEDWMYQSRATLARRVRGSLLRLAEQAAAQGEFVKAAILTERACWLPGAPPLEAEDTERSLILLTAGQSPLLGQLRQQVNLNRSWSVADAQQTLLPRFLVQERRSMLARPLPTKESEAGDLVLGTNGFLNHSVVPRALRLYAGRYPQAQLAFRELFTGAQLEALANGTVDVGFVTLPINDDHIAWELLWREAYIALLPATHPLALRRAVPLAALAGEPFVMHPRAVNPLLYDHVLELLSRNGIVPSHLLEGAIPQTRNQFVAGGFGYTLALPSWPAELPGLVRRPIHYAPHQQPMVMDGAVAWHRTRVSAAATAFVDIVLSLKLSSQQ